MLDSFNTIDFYIESNITRYREWATLSETLRAHVQAMATNTSFRAPTENFRTIREPGISVWPGVNSGSWKAGTPLL